MEFPGTPPPPLSKRNTKQKEVRKRVRSELGWYDKVQRIWYVVKKKIVSPHICFLVTVQVEVGCVAGQIWWRREECEFSSWCLGSAACAARACLLATVFKGTTRQRQRQMHLEKAPKNQSWYLRPAAACAGLRSTACPCSQTGIPQNTVFALNDDDGNYDNDDNDDDVDDEDNNKGDDVAWQQWVGSGLEWWQWWCWG